MKITVYEKINYVLKDKEDFIMLNKIKEVEKYNLNVNDKVIIKLIRSQLKKNWRLSLINYLDKIKLKYKK